MTDGIPRSQLVLAAVALLVVALLGARHLGRSGAAAPASTIAAAPAGARVERAPATAATVHVAGAVRRPGVYRLPAGARIDDAVRRAGGATRRADLGAVNLAAKAEDGRQVLVPERAPAAGGGSVVAAEGPLSLSTATMEQLDGLPGIGPLTAEKILAHRDEHGGFGSVEELGEVPGIGDKRLAALQEEVVP